MTVTLLPQFELFFVYNFILDGVWTRVAAAARMPHACLSLKCRIRGRKSYFRVSQNESKIQNIFPLLMIHFVVYLIDFEKGLAVLRT